jgi:hypothetical protein
LKRSAIHWTAALELSRPANTGWFDPTLGLVILGVSAPGGISGTTGYFAGKVGIGATKPQHTLDVSGSLRVVGISAATPVADFITSATFNATTLPYGLRVWVDDGAWSGTLMTLGKPIGGLRYTPVFEFNNNASQTNWKKPDLRLTSFGSNPGALGDMAYLTPVVQAASDAAGSTAQIFRVQRDDNAKLTTADLFQ